MQEEALYISISNISIVRVKKIILGRLPSFMGAFEANKINELQ
jgi:hypothetical protein